MLNKRYFIVKNKTSNGDASEILTGVSQGQNYSLMKMDFEQTTIPTGAGVIEYADGKEFAVAATSVIFTDYTGLTDSEFANAYLPFTTNEKNQGRILRQGIVAWAAKNSGSWPNSYHEAVWPNYDSLNQRLSDGAITPAYLVSLSIPNIINDPTTTDNIDLTSLNLMISNMFNEIFNKYPR